MSESVVAGFELWDMESRNLLDDFDTEDEAVEAVRELIALNGAGCADALALTRVDADGRMITLAMGAALAELAAATPPGRGRLPA
jgi:hypothetical protein